MSDNLNFANKLGAIDWGFRNLKNEGVHSFHWYPATFVSAVPGTLVPILSCKNDVVLDPFCGSATSGVESVRLGRRFIGIDTNPVAILIAHAKLYVPERSSFVRNLDLHNLDVRYSSWSPNEFQHPRESTLLRWYHRNTYQELSFLLSHISRVKNPAVRRCAQAIFSSILKSTSSQTKHWGWVCDNVVPKPSEIRYREAIVAFQKAARDYLDSTDRLVQDLKHRGGDYRRKAVRQASDLVCGDCINAIKQLREESVDLILTSPPYYGVADYIKSQRLSFLWFDHPELRVLGYSFSDFERLRRMEAGSRQFRHRSNSFDLYIRYMSEFFREARRVLKKDGRLALVIGESTARRATLDSLIDIAGESSLSLVYQSTRDIKETRRRLMAKVKDENIVVFKTT